MATMTLCNSWSAQNLKLTSKKHLVLFGNLNKRSTWGWRWEGVAHKMSWIDRPPVYLPLNALYPRISPKINEIKLTVKRSSSICSKGELTAKLKLWWILKHLCFSSLRKLQLLSKWRHQFLHFFFSTSLFNMWDVQVPLVKLMFRTIFFWTESY